MSQITTAQTVGWLITAFGIGVSLIWNFSNSLYGHRLAKRLRIEQYQSSQWERIRGKIDKSLEELIDASRLVVDQARKLDDAELQLDLFNVVMVDAQDALASALEEASRSEYCTGKTWSDVANGYLHGSETSWDLVLQSVSVAQAAPDKAERVRALAAMRVPIGEIRDRVNEACRIQDRELDPNRL